MRQAHELLDYSTWAGRCWYCTCGHWQWRGPWQQAYADCLDAYEQHRDLWEQAEAELDQAEAGA